MEVLLVVLFDSLLEGADELAAIIGEDILYGEGEHHLDSWAVRAVHWPWAFHQA